MKVLCPNAGKTRGESMRLAVAVMLAVLIACMAGISAAGRGGNETEILPFDPVTATAATVKTATPPSSA